MSIKITAELLKTIRLKFTDGGPADQDYWIAQEIERLNGIQGSISALSGLKEEARVEYDKRVADLNCRIAEIQKKCDHVDTRYYPDASGNNDSDTQCNICGKWGV